MCEEVGGRKVENKGTKEILIKFKAIHTKYYTCKNIIYDQYYLFGIDLLVTISHF